MNKFKIYHEQEFIKSYCMTIKGYYAKVVMHHLDMTGRIVREEIEDSLLNYSHTTEWAKILLKRNDYGTSSKKAFLGSWKRFLRWLFLRNIINGNALEFASVHCLVSGLEPEINLPMNLHRLIYNYIPPMAYTEKTKEAYRLTLFRYLRFVASYPGSANFSVENAFAVPILKDWLRKCSSKQTFQTAYQQSSFLSNFLDHLVHEGEIENNSLALFYESYGLPKIKILRALISDGSEENLLALKAPALFESPLAKEMNNFVKWKRTMGCRYITGARNLHYFDIFLRNRDSILPINAELLNSYLDSMEGLLPSTINSRINNVYSFCSYLRRYIPNSSEVTVLTKNAATPKRHPYILMPEEFKIIAEEIKSLCEAKSRHPFTEKGILTSLQLLYATGLRISEAFCLQNKDVDLENGILSIQKTKFLKDRLVPVSESVRKMLLAYVVKRDEVCNENHHNALFFPSSRHIPINADYLRRKFNKAATKTVANDDPKNCKPRIHDLRHSFAVRRLLQWYQDGDDVQNKLPVLSTYLGHVNIAATQVYITVTRQLLEEAGKRFNEYSGFLIKKDN